MPTKCSLICIDFLNTNPILIQLAYLFVVSVSGSCQIFFVNNRRFYLVLWLKQRLLHVWHGIDRWQCNWRVAWTSSRMCAGKRRTLWATIVTIFSHMTRDVSVFVKRDAIFDWFCKLPEMRTSKWRKVVRQHTEGMVGNVIRILLEI